LASAFSLLLTQAMAAQLYACGQLKNAAVAISDSTKNEIMKKVDFFIDPLQQKADRIGLGKEYAQSVKDATLLASARLEDLEARKRKAARQTELSESLGISQEQYAQLVEEGSDSEGLFVPVSNVDNQDGKDDDVGNSDSDFEKGSESSCQATPIKVCSLLRRRSSRSLPLPGHCPSRRLRLPKSRSTRNLPPSGRRSSRRLPPSRHHGGCVQRSWRPP